MDPETRVARSDVGDAHRLSLSEALSISESRPSQGETTVRKRFCAPAEIAVLAALAAPCRDMGTERAVPPAQTPIYTREKYTFITLAKAFFPVDASICRLRQRLRHAVHRHCHHRRGIAGSTAAAMLGRAGISTVLIDPHESYPADFRVEKLSGHGQVERFLQTGIAESVLRRATFAGENWIARFGHLLDKAPSRQFNILYDSLVNASATKFPTGVETHLRQGGLDRDQPGAAEDHARPTTRRSRPAWSCSPTA